MVGTFQFIGKAMKSGKHFKFLSKLASVLGDEDLTVSLAYSDKKYFVSISTHTSSQFQFDHGGYQRTVEITPKDLDKDSEKLLKELVNIYKYLLKKKEVEDEDATQGN